MHVRMPAQKAFIHSIGTAVPDHVIDETVVRAHLDEWLGDKCELGPAVLDLMHGTRVERRHFAFTPRELLEARGLDWMNEQYAARVVPLAETAARRALESAGAEPADVDLVITTSCTGFMIPPLDAHLANRMGMKRDLKRLPVTELGCAAGAAAIARAADYLRAYPDQTVLVIAAELPSATFQLKDLSKGNLVASLLFADGVAAMVLRGTPRDGGGPFVESSASTWFPDTLDVMGFDLRSTGFHLVLSPRIPGIVKREVRPFLDRWLGSQGLSRADLSWFALHPGGRKVLENLETTLEIPREQVAASWEVLRTFGNLSSATVLFILDELWRTAPPKPGTRGLLAAFGPAFGAEASLLGWS